MINASKLESVPYQWIVVWVTDGPTLDIVKKNGRSSRQGNQSDARVDKLEKQETHKKLHKGTSQQTKDSWESEMDYQKAHNTE